MLRHRTFRPVALLTVALVAMGIGLAAPASAAPKPRLPITLTSDLSGSTTGSTSVAFSWSSPGAGATYTCTLDGVVSACTSPKSYTGLASGRHTFVLKGKLNGSYRPGSVTSSWTVDITPPGAPTVVDVHSPTSSTSALVYFSNNDPSAVAHTCALDGGAPVVCTSPWPTGTLAEGDHTVVVQSRDFQGVLGGSDSTTWTVDLTAPANVLVTAPSSPAASSDADITFSAAGATAFTCSLDGATAAACTSPWHLTGLADGQHTVTVSASDGVGNAAEPGSAVWTIDTTAPAAPTVLTGPADPTNQTTADVVLDLVDPADSLECRLDTVTWSACPAPLHWAGLGAGSHELVLRLVDSTGNASAGTTLTWVVDLSAPAPAQFLSGPAAASNVRLPDFDFVLTDPTATGFKCKLDAGAWVACDIDTVPLPAAPGLEEGAHVLSVVSVDASDNQSAPVNWVWHVDLTAPAAPAFTEAPSASSSATSARFSFVTEAGAGVMCSVDGAASTQCASPFLLSGLALGDHTFAVTQTDAAGNTGTAGTHAWTVTAPVTPTPDPVTPPAPPLPAPQPATVAPVSVSLTASRALLGRSTAAFSAAVTAVTGGLTSGATTVPVAVTCTDAAASSVSCASGAVRGATVKPTTALVPGQTYALRVSGTDAAGRAASASVSFRASTAEQETSPAAVNRWSVVKTAKAYGRSYLSAAAKGSTLSTTFRGRAVTWYTMTGPGQGRATVFVDGVAKGKVNNWSAATRWHVARTVSGLKAGTHSLKVVVAGTKGATAGTGTAVAFDGLKVGTKLTASPRTTTTWARVAAKAASGRAYAASAVKGSTASFTFRGSSVTWLTARGPSMGKAKVYVDGVLKLKVDGYAKKAGWNVRRSLAGLGDRVHTVTVKVTGTKRRAATGTTVVVDRWLVG